jgi:hypothetical protein
MADFSVERPIEAMREAIPETAVHPRVLRLPWDSPGNSSGDAHYAQLFVVWRDPGGPRALHGALRPIVEASLLMDLCRVGETRTLGALFGMRLVLFEAVAGSDEALAAFGFARASLDEDSRRSIAHARGEASVLGREVPDDCWAVYSADARTTPTALALEEALAPHVAGQVFGQEPGTLVSALDAARRERGLGTLFPPGAEALAALDLLEHDLVADEEGVIRWIPPSCFLALCDAIAVVAAREGHEVAWAECEPDPDGIAPPPMIRVTTSDGHAHVPLGLELLRWCVMPRRLGEVIPPLRVWLHDRL